MGPIRGNLARHSDDKNQMGTVTLKSSRKFLLPRSGVATILDMHTDLSFN